MEDTLDNFTLGDLRKIAEKFKVFAVKGNGRPVIVRAREAGVHFGHLVSYESRTVILENSRRLWQFKAPKGVALDGVAAFGIIHKDSKIGAEVKSIIILDACEIIDCEPEAAKTIREAPCQSN